MKTLTFRKLSPRKQYFYSILLILIVSGGCFIFSSYTGYHTTALLLLVTVSLIAMFGEMYPVIAAAILSALIWNFFFIPPLYTFHIGKSEDILMFLMYFVIAMLNAVLTLKIRQMEENEQLRKERENFRRQYTHLVSILSSELVTPVSYLSSLAEKLMKKQSGSGGFSDFESVPEIATASSEMSNHIENILTISCIETDTIVLNYGWCDINKLLHEVIKRKRESGITQHVDIQIPASTPSFQLDQRLIKLLLENLLNNLLTHVTADSTITVRASCIIDQLVIIAEVEGKELPESNIDRVFRKKYTLDECINSGGELGLLAVKGIVETHGGKVTYSQTIHEGTSFTISIPAKTYYSNGKDSGESEAFMP